MSETVNLYQSDVKLLSDQELETLSEELAEAYQRSGYEDTYWIDDAAETRYYELRSEIQRRWMLAHPDWKPAPPSELIKLTLSSMAESLRLSVEVSREFDRAFGPNVGDAIAVRRPTRIQP